MLCEKPMAATEEDCEAMIEAAEANHVKLMVAYRLHFEKGNLEAIRLAESGKLGELRFFGSEFALQVDPENIRVTMPVEQGGGPVYEWAFTASMLHDTCSAPNPRRFSPLAPTRAREGSKNGGNDLCGDVLLWRCALAEIV